MKIAIGSDHAGFELKQKVVAHLTEQGIHVIDVGTTSTESTNFVTYAVKVAELVNANEANYGILCCGTGIGMSMAANKIHGIRAALLSDSFSAKATKEHNNANVICLGARVIGESLALTIVDTFLTAQFQGGRHQKRVEQIMTLENKR
ncbi:ribose 5-phosphate isomerase B [Vagococcus acidifermentans]|uniref:Ribose 5-phosphate isomerase B n=1 Tax=Vagococcus acidifermentans TaxID=564710 RepID=A0A430B2X5_9ENTE|nr:ribose 5-phosphate isomerase B [Vagococcus acidifermentans]RSU14673.1 ribose 5-phosphate isomerase B [Vagococcus acidifermentans]